MKRLLQSLSYVGLALSLLPAFFLVRGAIDTPTYRGLMIAGLILWFSTAVLWIKPSRGEDG